MALTRTNVTLPEELMRQVDEVAGPRGRSRYVANAVRRQVQHDRQRRVFQAAYDTAASLPGRMTDAEALAFARALRAGWSRAE